MGAKGGRQQHRPIVLPDVPVLTKDEIRDMIQAQVMEILNSKHNEIYNAYDYRIREMVDYWLDDLETELYEQIPDEEITLENIPDLVDRFVEKFRENWERYLDEMDYYAQDAGKSVTKKRNTKNKQKGRGIGKSEPRAPPELKDVPEDPMRLIIEKLDKKDIRKMMATSKEHRDIGKSIIEKELREETDITIDDILKRRKQLKGKHIDVETFLVRLLEKNEITDSMLIDAIKFRNGRFLKFINALLDRGVNPNVRDINNMTPLHEAVIKSDITIINLLLERGADINAKNNHDKTPLYMAVSTKNDAICELLLERGADPNVQDSDDERWTPLHLAAIYGLTNICRLLINAGGSVNVLDTEGRTPLYWAVRNGRKDICKLLLENGADVNANQELYGDTALHTAVWNKQTDICLLLLEYGANPDIKNSQGNTPLDIATTKNYTEIVELIRGWQTTHSGGAIHASYKGRKYKVRTGSRGGRYILVGKDKKRVYL